MTGQWVRPKKVPRKKEPTERIEALVPMLNYLGGRSPSPSKKATPKTPAQPPLAQDPILRSMQRAQAQRNERPTSSHSRNAPEHQIIVEEHIYADDDEDYEDDYHHTRSPPTTRIHPRPALPPPPRHLPIPKPKPRVPSYERPVTRTITKQQPVAPRRVPSFHNYRAQHERMVAARWESATTPLDLSSSAVARPRYRY